jgi:hypothetical protein
VIGNVGRSAFTSTLKIINTYGAIPHPIPHCIPISNVGDKENMRTHRLSEHVAVIVSLLHRALNEYFEACGLLGPLPHVVVKV